MVNVRIRKIAVAGVLSAVVIVLGLTGVGLIPLPLGAVTILHIPVIIGAILEGPWVGLFIGLLFGLFSLIQSAIAAAAPLDAAFVNPLISVVPRLFIGPAAWVLYTLISGELKRRRSSPGAALPGAEAHTEISTVKVPREIAAIITASVVGSLVNTILVLSALGLLGQVPWPVIFTVAVTNGPAEAATAAVIILAIVLAWKRIPRGGGKSRLSREG
jgi:uncharacterized membrane protein